jgi:tetratricopeptide (TPR) repeat protein
VEVAMNTMWRRSLAILGAVGVMAAGLPGLALGAGSGEENKPAASAPAKPVDPDYAAAVKSIKAEKYAAAIPLLEGVVKRDATNADAYNWLAYSIRKNGDPAASIPLYEKALALDPKHRGAHEYIGEAYLMLNNLPKAKEHLAKLDKLCFFSCEEYRDLKKAVERYEKNGGKTSTR